MSPTLKTCALLILAAMLAGCSASNQEELQGWMAEQRRVTKPKVVPLSEPVDFKPQAYSQQAAVEPFTNLKLTQALKRDSAQAAVNATLIAPELSRRKEPLESAPLDTVMMVGSLVKQGQPVALVRIDSLLYQVRVGNYLGQNYGRITKISESELALREIVQDAAGEWIERTATLQLREATK
jgi:type IV pilus assembly protein PilP